MKKTILIGAAILLLATGLVQAQGIRKVKMDDVLQLIRESREPLIVNFWASWCTPCIHEIPWFEKQVAAYKEKGVKLVLVSLDFADDYPKNLQAFVKKNGCQSTVVWLSETNADSFCPKIDSSWQGTIPASLLVNNAKQYRQFFGRQLTEAQLAIELKKLVE